LAACGGGNPLSHIGLFLKQANLPAILRVDKNAVRFVSRKEAGPEQLHAGSGKRAQQKRHMPPALSSTAEPTHNSIAYSRTGLYFSERGTPGIPP
jgi:hypothetical protein